MYMYVSTYMYIPGLPQLYIQKPLVEEDLEFLRTKNKVWNKLFYFSHLIIVPPSLLWFSKTNKYNESLIERYH